MDGNAFVIEQAAAHRFPSLATPSLPKLDFVVHDCFTGGFVPPELFTIEFWSDLAMLVKTDGIVAIVRVALGRDCKYHLLTLRLII